MVGGMWSNPGPSTAGGICSTPGPSRAGGICSSSSSSNPDKTFPAEVVPESLSILDCKIADIRKSLVAYDLELEKVKSKTFFFMLKKKLKK